jgi:hypothetical protein
MLVLIEGDGFQFFLNPDWREFVREEDLRYIELFIPDLKERAQQFPRELYDQLSSLSLGPLVTAEVGSNLFERPSFRDLPSQFDRL